MNVCCLSFRLVSAWIAFLPLLLVQDGFAAVNWINASDGFWKEGTNWSTGRAPNSDLGSTLITNANTKIVTIDALTPSTNLTISSLTISGTSGATNTLLLADVGTNNPLTLLSSELKITQGGALIVTNSSLVLTGSFSQFNIVAGDVTLESGSIRIIEDSDVTDITAFVRVGRTNAASLTINGGAMEVGTLLLADAPFAQLGAEGRLKITAGLLSLAGVLSIGDGTRGTGLVEVLGGELRVANNQTNITRVGDNGVGQMIISNATALLGNVSVARHDGALGTLIVQTNGFLQLTDDLSIGRFSGATGEVWVAGGRLEVVGASIWVGREGVGQLTVSDGLVTSRSIYVATVATNTAYGTAGLTGGGMILSSNLVIGSESASSAQMSVAGGDLTVTNSATNAAVNIVRGSLTLSGGTMTVDSLLATNPAGQLVFDRGTLRTKGSLVANGSPFVVGNGMQAATLELLGGTHAFADGLIISSNATLTGCGTIFGPIVNHGTIITNCMTTPGLPTITRQPESQTVAQGGTATFTVTATSDPPPSYQWRFSGLMGNIPGATNSTLIIANAQATNAGNYRVIVSNASGSVMSELAALRVLVPPAITNVRVADRTSFGFSFEGANGLTYTIEYKNTLNEPTWTTLRIESGTGSISDIADDLTAVPSRFYRIRVE